MVVRGDDIHAEQRVWYVTFDAGHNYCIFEGNALDDTIAVLEELQGRTTGEHTIVKARMMPLPNRYDDTPTFPTGPSYDIVKSIHEPVNIGNIHSEVMGDMLVLSNVACRYMSGLVEYKSFVNINLAYVDQMIPVLISKLRKVRDAPLMLYDDWRVLSKIKDDWYSFRYID